MARKRFHGLQKVKLRATWSKYNLYNLTRIKLPPVKFRTYFQQKWSAKSAMRAYHGEQVREKQWQRMFSRKLNAVVPMNARYLAEYDGSEQAAGRGSGVERTPYYQRDDVSLANPKQRPTPYMHMTFAPLERRLDMAVWRALFASSARQARQMVIHGQVKVNGQKMPYPGYLLNPGDMFQVEPERVLFATGEMKDPAQAREGRIKRKARTRVNILRDERRAKMRKKREAARAAREAANSEVLTVREKSTPRRIPKPEEEQRKETRKQYQILLRQVRGFMESASTTMRAKKKQEVRAYARDIKNAMGSTGSKKTDVKTIEQTFQSLLARLHTVTGIQLHPDVGSLDKSLLNLFEPEKAETSKDTVEELSAEDQKKLREAIVRMRENPVDETKPYATPWRPRPYMSAFAFIPRYLEVNQNICSAVYLRHPVARPGMAEVPSPFGAETQQLAFNWYLKRR